MWWLSTGGTSGGLVALGLCALLAPGPLILELPAATWPELPLLGPGTDEFNVRFCQKVLAFTHLESLRS